MTITEWISLVANIMEILVGGVALFLAWTQREKISAAFSVLLNYSLQTSLSDLRHWIEKLQESSSEDNDVSKKFRIALAYIFGKIKGNIILNDHFGDRMLKRMKLIMDDLDNSQTVNETTKISLCSEIKESLATLEVENYKSKSKNN